MRRQERDSDSDSERESDREGGKDSGRHSGGERKPEKGKNNDNAKSTNTDFLREEKHSV